MADVLVNYSIAAQPGQWIVVVTTTLGEPIAAACQRAILQAGAHSTVMLGADSLNTGFLKEANDEQLEFVSPVTQLITEKADARILILAPANTRAMMSVDPDRTALRDKGKFGRQYSAPWLLHVPQAAIHHSSLGPAGFGTTLIQRFQRCGLEPRTKGSVSPS